LTLSRYNDAVQKSYDAIVIGAGLIGLSLAWKLARAGARVLLLDRREPGQEASHAGGGMIADLDPVLPAELRELAHRSAALFPSFVAELSAESGRSIDLRDDGVIDFEQHPIAESEGIRAIGAAEALALEPRLNLPPDPAYLMQERSVDPRHLVAALLAALGKCSSQVEIRTGEAVAKIVAERGRAEGIVTERASYAAERVINCAGAWACQIDGPRLPTLPVKGHMLSLAFPGELAMDAAVREEKRVLRHVLRSRWCYILPRSNGLYVVGSSVEPAGFDKTLNTHRIKRLHEAAARLIPQFAEAKIAEAWTGLRPGTPDNLPLMGETALPGYFAATGHYRDGILLAPVTAEVMCALVLEGRSPVSLERFSPQRFSQAASRLL
jgi:glycine oxidase